MRDRLRKLWRWWRAGWCSHVITYTPEGDPVYPTGRVIKANADNWRIGIRNRILREFKCRKCETRLWELY